ncbi:hypothetical protein [Prochlorococcus sp. MIT 1223]|uniref:hypothetical protein n=1 Tax=Prochlorococcus sp. MIT 1223 TaxID=3096217 RepID=UPI002A7526AF|nr:hypothetical protein [Prochlorococcus sp. MIT 1223]
MAEEPLERLRLTLMQDLLPVGIAIFDRVKIKGPRSVLDTLTESTQPLQDLREEGEPLAKSIREQLDKIKPGLGNPIMSVNIEVNEEEVEIEDNENMKPLLHILNNIEHRLNILNGYLQSDTDEKSITESSVEN